VRTIIALRWEAASRSLSVSTRWWNGSYSLPFCISTGICRHHEDCSLRAPAGEPLTPEVAGQVVQWVNLSWLRAGIDGVVAILLLVAGSRRDAW